MFRRAAARFAEVGAPLVVLLVLGPAVAATEFRPWGKAKLVRIFAFGLVLSLIGLGGWLITIHFLTEHHLQQAQRAYDRQHYSEALKHLNKADEFRPRSPEIQLRLARVHRLLGSYTCQCI